MKKTLTVLLVSMLMGTAAMAQSAAIDSCVAMIEAGKYAPAIERLRSVLKERDRLPEDLRAKAHYNLTDALMRELNRKRTEMKNELAPSYGGYIYEASDHILEARKLLAANKGLTAPVKEQVRKLKHELTLSTLDNIKELEGTGDPTLAIALVNGAERATRYMIMLDSNFYLAYDYLGQALMLKGDSLRALEVLQKGIDCYTHIPQIEPDAYAGNMVYRATTVLMYTKKDLAAAEATLAAGLAMMAADKEKVKANKGMTELRRKLVLDKLGKTETDLNMLLLDLYMLKPELTPNEQEKMRLAATADSTNLPLLMAYAKVLDRTDHAAALEQYARMYRRYGREYDVVFNYGVMCSNMAARLSQAPDPDRNAISGYMRTSYSVLQEAEAIDPTDKRLMAALAQIAKNLGLTSKEKYYRAKAQ